MAYFISPLQCECWLSQQPLPRLVVSNSEDQVVSQQLVCGYGPKITVLGKLAEGCTILVVVLPRFLAATVETIVLKGDVAMRLTV